MRPSGGGQTHGEVMRAGMRSVARSAAVWVAVSIAASCLAAPVIADSPAPPAARKKVVVSEERVREVHRRAIIVDTHADTLWRVLDDGDDITVRSDKGHLDLPRMLEGGIDGQFFSIWPQPAYGPDGYVKRSLRLIDALMRTIDRSGGRMFLAVTPDDIRR